MRLADRNIDKANYKGEYTALGYRSATIARREGRTPQRLSGEAHQLYDRIELIGQSRMFMMDNAIYKGLIERAVSYIVGDGFTIQSKCVNKDTRLLVEKRWKAFWKKPEITNTMSGTDCEKMTSREVLTCGDTGTLKTTQNKIQLFEAEQITKSELGDIGIDRDAYGRPVAFYVGGYKKYGYIDKRTIKPYTPQQFLFISTPERPSCIRCVPPCQASFPMFHRIDDVCDSEAIAWQLLARLALSQTQEHGREVAFAESKEDDESNKEFKTRITELDYALIFHGKPGEEIKGIERNIPGKDFSASLRMFLRLAGLPIGLPLEIILLDWTQSNYSQSRAVLLQAFLAFLGWQDKNADFFLSPIFEWQVINDIVDGIYKDLDQTGILEHDWIKPAFPWIDQLKEALAWCAKLNQGLSLHATVLKSLGEEREDFNNERQKEIEDAIDRSKAIKEKHGVEVPWQIFAGLLSPDMEKINTSLLHDMANADEKIPKGAK